MKNEMQLLHGDCLERLKELPDNSVDSVVTDPPYGLSFMGKKWDYDVPSEKVWRECLRVLKPGGHLLAFAGTRTQHRMAVRIEDAGFEIRDMIAWMYGSGFPKSLDVSKAIDKAAGAERDRVVEYAGTSGSLSGPRMNVIDGGDPVTDAAREWSGWGTALKPSLEPITVARKPLIGTVAENVLTHGTGGINVDGCRVGDESTTTIRTGNSGAHGRYGKDDRVFTRQNPPGRWPANVIHDGSDEVVELFPMTGKGNGGEPYNYAGKEYNNKDSSMFNGDKPQAPSNFNDNGSAARFFYCAKASKRDRDEGLEGFEIKEVRGGGGRVSEGYDESTQHLKEAARKYGAVKTAKANTHPTVKPTDLMRYLCRLVTPPNGIVLDPFMGSGSTGKAAMLEGFQFIGIEREAEYMEIAKSRIEAVKTLI